MPPVPTNCIAVAALASMALPSAKTGPGPFLKTYARRISNCTHFATFILHYEIGKAKYFGQSSSWEQGGRVRAR